MALAGHACDEALACTYTCMQGLLSRSQESLRAIKRGVVGNRVVVLLEIRHHI